MATVELLATEPVNTQPVLTVVVPDCVMRGVSVHIDPEPFWRDPAYLNTIDDTTLGETE